MAKTEGAQTLPPDRQLHLWQAVRVLCETKVSRTGRKITPRAAVKMLFESGGLLSIVGGNYDLLASTNPERQTRLIEMCVVQEGSQIILKEKSGVVDRREILSRVFVSHRHQHERTLLQRYYEIAKELKADPLKEFCWNNILMDRLNRPRKSLPWARTGRLHLRINEGSLTIVSD